jgi:hypothetical protein
MPLLTVQITDENLNRLGWIAGDSYGGDVSQQAIP